ncbi:hypothetical protein CPLU01_09183 [Colletotrichum plurivorum]|uniref:Uncharacterized protein n=1 Tax=Colletotrichum plurivorum TaxID=2175906 RepID=A0A8H6KAU3_9PEZI|nr:hypothetical protein CPLU01_09183 [Colletotrichum plurivorum]
MVETVDGYLPSAEMHQQAPPPVSPFLSTSASQSAGGKFGRHVLSATGGMGKRDPDVRSSGSGSGRDT